MIFLVRVVHCARNEEAKKKHRGGNLAGFFVGEIRPLQERSGLRLCRLRYRTKSLSISGSVPRKITVPAQASPPHAHLDQCLKYTFQLAHMLQKCSKTVYLQSYFVILSSLFVGRRAANLCYWSGFNPLLFFAYGDYGCHKTSLSAMFVGGVGCALADNGLT